MSSVMRFIILGESNTGKTRFFNKLQNIISLKNNILTPGLLLFINNTFLDCNFFRATTLLFFNRVSL